MARKKSTKQLIGLSNKTRWSYYMQAIEPHDPKILEAFPDYHPMWIVQSQNMEVTGAKFKYMRETLLGLSIDQCAAYLRLDRVTIYRYEGERARIPFSAFELLRVLYESANFKMSHVSWDGWFINQQGELVSPDCRIQFTPNELSYIRQVHNYNRALKQEVSRLNDELEAAIKKQTELERNQVEAEILEELIELERALAAISSKIGKSKVVSLQPPQKLQRTSKEIAA